VTLRDVADAAESSEAMERTDHLPQSTQSKLSS
jgi:hypothetical protein